jgi:hypothetical protein
MTRVIKLWKVRWTEHASLIVLVRDLSMDMFSDAGKRGWGDQASHLAVWIFEKGVEIKKAGNKILIIMKFKSV